MSAPGGRTSAERARICNEIERKLAALPETAEKGTLRGVLLRLRLARENAARFEDEFQKLAAVSENVANDTPAGRLHALIESLQPRR